MSDDESKTGEDRKEISLDEHHDVRAWCNALGCDEAQLRLAVQKVGHSAEKVREYLRNY
jgi:hypothetical protein